jgi:hypothetical protein
LHDGLWRGDRHGRRRCFHRGRGNRLSGCFRGHDGDRCRGRFNQVCLRFGLLLRTAFATLSAIASVAAPATAASAFARRFLTRGSSGFALLKLRGLFVPGLTGRTRLARGFFAAFLCAGFLRARLN